mmetsp:Transcript_134984/g.305534  ORF Transcript_134984/g.305534 Transcript_134984/m.305534 type:complete len:253 (-) Transcript_134984:515-1273(-)
MRRSCRSRDISLHLGALPCCRPKILSRGSFAAGLAAGSHSFFHSLRLLISCFQLPPSHCLLRVLWRSTGTRAGSTTFSTATPGATTSDSAPFTLGESCRWLTVQSFCTTLCGYELTHEASTFTSHKRVSQQVFDRRALLSVLRQQLPDQVVQFRRVLLWNRVILLRHDLVDQTQQIACCECMLQHAELVQHASQGPDVRLEGVWAVFADLWRHVVRRAHHRYRLHHRSLQNSGDPKIPHFHNRSLVGEEDIG